MAWMRAFAVVSLILAGTIAAAAAMVPLRSADIYADTLPANGFPLWYDGFDLGTGVRLGTEPGTEWVVHEGEFRGMPPATLRSQFASPWAHATVDLSQFDRMTLATELENVPAQRGRSGAGIAFWSNGEEYAYAIYRRDLGRVEIGMRTEAGAEILHTVGSLPDRDSISLRVSLNGSEASVVVDEALVQIDAGQLVGNTRHGIVADSDNRSRFTHFTVSRS